ncbi:MAG: hypothetical protein AB8B91_22885, partial [Rubripirellula sp.]
ALAFSSSLCLNLLQASAGIIAGLTPKLHKVQETAKSGSSMAVFRALLGPIGLTAGHFLLAALRAAGGNVRLSTSKGD